MSIKTYAVEFALAESVFVDDEMSIKGKVLSIAITSYDVEDFEYKVQWWLNGEPKEHWFKSWQLKAVPCP